MNPTLQFFAEFLVSRFFFIVPMAVTCLTFIWLMAYSSWSIGLTFSKDIWPKIKDDPNAISRWHGCRLLALAFVCGCSAIAGAIAADIV